MTWNSRYLSPDKNLWQGRPDLPPASSFFQVVKQLDLLNYKSISNKQKMFAVIGFKCDEGVRRNFGRVGAAEGPDAIRQMLARLPVQAKDFIMFDAGDITCTDGDLESAQAAYSEVIHILLGEDITPIGLGGGHEIAWATYLGIAKNIPLETERLGIVNFDSHFDMRPLQNDLGTSGTSFLQIAHACREMKRRFDYSCIGIQHAGNIRELFDTAKQYNAHIFWADELHHGLTEKCIDFLDRIVDQNDVIYLSLCLDVFSSAFAPGVSATEPLGLWPWQIVPFIRQLAASGKVISYDIAELAPRYDIDHCTAKLAANLIYEIIHNHSDHPRNW